MYRRLSLIILIISLIILSAIITPPTFAQDSESNDSGLPDLKIIELTFIDPEVEDLRPGYKTKISIHFINQGNKSIDKDWSLTVRDNDRRIREETISGTILPNETEFFNFTYSTKEGNRRFNVTLDVNNDIEELDEENNCLETIVTVPKIHIHYYWWIYFLPFLPLILIGIFAYWFLYRGGKYKLFVKFYSLIRKK